MKTSVKTIFLLLFIFSLNSCFPDDTSVEPSEQELATELISATWRLGTIFVDDIDRTLHYPGFSFTFSDGTYQSTNAGELFNASGTWEWGSETTINEILLDDGKVLNIQSFTTSQLVFSFTQSDGGVRYGIAGNYVVTLIK